MCILQEMLNRFDPFEEQFISPFLSNCLSLMLGIAIHCILHSQAMLERGVCELAHSFFHFILFFKNTGMSHDKVSRTEVHVSRRYMYIYIYCHEMYMCLYSGYNI